MAITKIADVIVPELFNRYVINRTMELSAFFQSGIVINSPEFDALASEAARTHNMPFFEDLQGESEPTLEDVKMTPAKIGSNKDVSTTILRQKMWAATNLSAALAGADPMKAIGDLVAQYWGARYAEGIDCDSCGRIWNHHGRSKRNTESGDQNGRSYS